MMRAGMIPEVISTFLSLLEVSSCGPLVEYFFTVTVFLLGLCWTAQWYQSLKQREVKSPFLIFIVFLDRQTLGELTCLLWT